MIKVLLGFILAVLATGCSTKVHRDFQAIDGSKANAMVVVGLPVYSNEQVLWNWDQAKVIADERCSSWGYAAAKKFGEAERLNLDSCKNWGNLSDPQLAQANSFKTHCFKGDNGDCLEYNVIIKYQCVDTPVQKNATE